MPANLPPQYFAAEKSYRQARTAAEKIEALENMLAIMPKHKGTDHLHGELRARIAKLTEESAHKQGGTRAQLYAVRKEGAAQVPLLGIPNSGKSQLLAALTGATPKVGPYPFTTQLPLPATLPFENVQIQVVDLPPLVADGTPHWVRSIVRQADLLLMVVDLSGDPLSELETVRRELAAMRIEPIAPGAVGSAEEPELSKRALVVANKCDAPDAADTFELLNLEYDARWPMIAVSAATGAGLEELKRAIFEALDVVRVYTKAPGQEPDFTRPIVLPRGSTVEEVAADIHKELRQKLKYAQVWGSGKFQGQKVSREYTVQDGDVVELFTSEIAP